MYKYGAEFESIVSGKTWIAGMHYQVERGIVYFIHELGKLESRLLTKEEILMEFIQKDVVKTKGLRV
jgi:hypothetical protein